MYKQFACLPFVCLPLNLAAQQASGIEADEEIIGSISLKDLLDIEVITASKIAQKMTDAPATVRTFSAEQIERMGFRDLKDIFRALPGFDLSYDSQGEVRTLVIGRGVPGNQKLTILQDGLKYSPATGERFVYGHNTPLSHLKQIEIVYGPASALYGADAFTGVINMISKDGADINGFEANTGYIDTGAAIIDFTAGHQLDNGLDYIFYARSYHGEDYSLQRDYPEYAVVNQYVGALSEHRVKYPIENWNIFFELEYQDWSFGLDWQHALETNAPTTVAANYAYVEENVWGQDLGHAFVKYEHQWSEALALTATVSFGRYEVAPESNFFVIQDLALTTARPSYKYALSENVKYEWQGIWHNEQFTVVGGMFFDDIKSFPKTKNLDDAPFDTSGPLIDDLSGFVDENGYTYGLLGFTESRFGQRNYDNWGGYLQGQSTLGEDTDITIGARYDDSAIYGSTVNPRIGIVYHHDGSHSSRFTYGSAYIQPANYYRWENWANPFAMHIPNQDIAPETIDSSSLSSTYFTDNYSFKAEIYYNELKNVIRPVPAKPQANNYPYYNPLRAIIGSSPDSGFVGINANQGVITTYGGEVELTVQQGDFLTTLAYSYVDGDDDGHPLAKTSNHKLLMNLEYSNGPWEIGATVRYYSAVNTSVLNSAYGTIEHGGNGEMAFAGATVAYANVKYQINDSLSVNLAIDNLMDRKHYGAAPYGESVWIIARAPQAGRKIWFNITFEI